MSSWITVWILVFATGMFIATLADPADRKKNRGAAAFMLVVMLAAGAILVFV
ncbi:MAG: hypothetical protein ACU85V_02450 [Gammaproteobacteria bacterium]